MPQRAFQSKIDAIAHNFVKFRQKYGVRGKERQANVDSSELCGQNFGSTQTFTLSREAGYALRDCKCNANPNRNKQ